MPSALGNSIWTALAPHIAELTLLTMTLSSTTDPHRIFENGKLKPGIYRIQNLRSETYLDVLQHSKELCCRPARDIGAKKGLVRPCLPFAVRVSEVLLKVGNQAIWNWIHGAEGT